MTELELLDRERRAIDRRIRQAKFESNKIHREIKTPVHRSSTNFRLAANGVTTDSKHGLPIAPNVLDRKFALAEPNQAWVGDLTYIATEEAGCFLL